MYYVDLDIMGDDVAEWAAGFGCSAEPIANIGGQHPSYRVSADSHEELDALMADSGFEPDTFIHIA